MIDKIERAIAHRLGWHTPACLIDPAYGTRCVPAGPRSVVIGMGPLGWHRYLAGRGRPHLVAVRGRLTARAAARAQALALSVLRAGIGPKGGARDDVLARAARADG